MLPLYYNWTSGRLPQWGDAGFSGSQANGEVAPWSQDFNHGYDSVVGRLNPTKRAQALQAANATFCDGQYYFPLFISNVAIDFGISGSTAQAQLTRDFYPHHMTLPGFQLTGQCYDQTSYGMLCEFVHNAQRQAFGQRANTNAPVIQLYVAGGVYPNAQGTLQPPQTTLGVTYNGTTNYNQSVKGQHKPILCLGYIMTIPREHTTGEYAPIWTVSFMVSDMLAGPYQDNLGTTVQQSNWLALLKGSGAQNFGTRANLAQNKKVLAFAQANSVNVISSSDS